MKIKYLGANNNMGYTRVAVIEYKETEQSQFSFINKKLSEFGFCFDGGCGWDNIIECTLEIDDKDEYEEVKDLYKQFKKEFKSA